jgi:hypothetical protein
VADIISQRVSGHLVNGIIVPVTKIKVLVRWDEAHVFGLDAATKSLHSPRKRNRRLGLSGGSSCNLWFAFPVPHGFSVKNPPNGPSWPAALREPRALSVYFTPIWVPVW